MNLEEQPNDLKVDSLEEMKNELKKSLFICQEELAFLENHMANQKATLNEIKEEIRQMQKYSVANNQLESRLSQCLDEIESSVNGGKKVQAPLN